MMEVREHEVARASAAFQPRYSEVVAPELERLMFNHAIEIIKRNANIDWEVEDILGHYARRFVKKLKYYKADEYPIEQFVHLVCKNVDSELMDEIIESRDRRNNLVWLDEALELHGEEVTSDQILTSDAEAATMRRLIQEDVRDTIARLEPQDQRIAELFLIHGSLRQVEKILNIHHFVFHRDIWPKFCKNFKKLWTA